MKNVLLVVSFTQTKEKKNQRFVFSRKSQTFRWSMVPWCLCQHHVKSSEKFVRESWFRWTLHESFFKGNNCYQDDIEIFIYPTTTEWIVNINVDSIQWMTSTFLRILFTQKKTLFAVILTAFFLFSFNYSTLHIYICLYDP